jgi:hypothetical protein
MSESGMIITESFPLMITHSAKLIILRTFVLRRLPRIGPYQEYTECQTFSQVVRNGSLHPLTRK